ncbi:histidine phosphatase family protein [Cellulophaga baltica]|uniref:SixA phosphatase family protein n=1 Tax=Cellulophaga TaxID=104264 RepID=UPI001C071C30|nr:MULTISPECIES: phosphoglycerate mutase family protein [Cellulophaga]MBU2994867.1 histidine phosphatase family protein [Cellulophaga baltica]MDO6766261.1 phosphoglycerate mutase family protein [Cellulophaga sp. 1_MG-2023]
MKTLILMRHGKSSWDLPVSDIDRALNERGVNDAHLVASEFIKTNLTIDALYSSPANRALHTSMIMLRSLDFPFSKFQIIKDLYDFSGESVMSFVKELNNDLNTVMIFGHNHAFTEIATTWGNYYIGNVPTAGLVKMNFDIDNWSEISKGKIETTIFPKQLK